MELLPIIYWSLLSVGIVVLIVIIFSFISFKFRKKHGNIPSEEIKGIERDKKVKITIASSIAEVAALLDDSIVEKDLLPIFDKLYKDESNKYILI